MIYEDQYTKDQVLEAVAILIEEETKGRVKKESIKFTDDLDIDLGFDSLELGGLIMAVTKTFGIQGRSFYIQVDDVVENILESNIPGVTIRDIRGLPRAK